MTKAEIRLKMKTERNAVAPEELLLFGKAIREKLFGLTFWRESNQLFTYLSFQSEVNTWWIVKEALSTQKDQRKQVFVPRVEGKLIKFYPIADTSSLNQSKFGVQEPDESHQTPYRSSGMHEKRLMLMPGLAFDPSGNRIGYGAGYYDRFLAEHKADGFVKLALAYDFQVIDKIEADEYDIKMDYILTPTRIIDCTKATVVT